MTITKDISSQLGRSMVEMLGVLAIIGILSVGGIAGYTKAMEKYQTSQTVDQISHIMVNVRTLYTNDGNYKGLDNALAISEKLVLEEMIVGNNIRNRYDGTVTLKTSNNDMYFELTYEKIPQKACMLVSTANWGDARSSGLVSIKINATEFNWTGTNKLPVQIKDAANACSSQTENTLVWLYN